jgi:hypothetical protein
MEAQPAKMTTITLVLSGALVLSAVPPSIAAPIPSNPVVMKTAAQGSVTNVRSRHHAWHNDGWVAGAIIGGLALGAIPAATTPPYDSAYSYGPYAVTYVLRVPFLPAVWLRRLQALRLPVLSLPSVRFWRAVLASRLELSMVPLPVALIKKTG